MNHRTATRAVLIASMLFASHAFASDIHKCIAATGTVTLTDGPCAQGDEMVKVRNGADQSGNAAGAQRVTLRRLPPRGVVMARSTPSRGLAMDVATLRAAHQNMTLLDKAARAMREQRLAALALN